MTMKKYNNITIKGQIMYQYIQGIKLRKKMDWKITKNEAIVYIITIKFIKKYSSYIPQMNAIKIYINYSSYIPLPPM